MDLVEHLGTQALDLTQAPLHAPSSLCLPLVRHVEEPVADDGADLDFAGFCRAAAEWVGAAGAAGVARGGTTSAGVGDLFVCERLGCCLSGSPPARPL